jgi:acetyl esterase/lipase
MLFSSLRFFLAAACVIASLPGLITFDSLPLWKATLAVTEYGHRLALLPALLLLGALFDRGTLTRLSSLLSVAALTLLLLPLGLMIHQSRTLAQDLRSALGLATPALAPDFKALFFGTPPAIVTHQTIDIPRATQPLRLLFTRPSSSSPAPCLILLHSGGWERGDPAEFPEWTHHWAASGYGVASITYRLAPVNPWPAQLDDVTTTLAYLKKHASSLGITGKDFVLIGRSAGGQIATAAAHGLKDPAIRGCVALYAPGDMTFAWKYATPDDVLDSPRLLRQYLGGAPEQAPENYRTASAIDLAQPGGPPTLLIHGRRDILVWELQSRRLAAHLARQNVPHFFLDLPWATHALDYAYHGPSSHLIRPTLDAFLKHAFSRHPMKPTRSN